MALIGSFQPSKVSMLAIKCRDFRMFQFAPANMLAKKKKKKTAEDSAKTFVYYVGNGFGIPRHFVKGYDLFS